MFEHLRLADGTVINVLAVPILEYCDLLLTSQSHQAIDLLGRQLQVTRPGHKALDFIKSLERDNLKQLFITCPTFYSEASFFLLQIVRLTVSSTQHKHAAFSTRST